LRHLEEVGFEGAPRVRGVDEQGREILTYISGEVPRRGDASLETDQALTEVGSLLRRYHEAVADFALPSGIDWHHRSGVSGPVTLVCHNDISPRNTVFRDGHPVAFLDWDFASPDPPA
jgi:Ser/Thr protein kinase RdoA (MazF antagonist)